MRHRKISVISIFYLKKIGNAENQTWGGRARSKNVIHCAPTADKLFSFAQNWSRKQPGREQPVEQRQVGVERQHPPVHQSAISQAASHPGLGIRRPAAENKVRVLKLTDVFSWQWRTRVERLLALGRLMIVSVRKCVGQCVTATRTAYNLVTHPTVWIFT